MDSILRAMDGGVGDHLRDEAATRIEHSEDSDIEDTLLAAVHKLRTNGFGGSSRQGQAEVYSDAVWICHTDVRDALVESLDFVGDDEFGFRKIGFQGYDVLSSDGVPRDYILLVDLQALTENPHRHRHLSQGLAREGFTLEMPTPVLVTQPAGIVVVEIGE